MTGMLSITSQADGTADNRGLITAELQVGTGYLIAEAIDERSTSVVVLETLPVVSISVTETQVKENIGSFNLLIESAPFHT